MNALDSLRRWAWVEGLSLLVLVVVAMPLKHLFAMPIAVRIAGSLHGLAFLLFVSALVRATAEQKWPTRVWLAALGVSLIPGGVFFFRRVLPEEPTTPR